MVYWGHTLVVSLTGEDEDQYEQFMLPLTAAFEAVAQMFSTNSFNEQEAKVSPSPTDWSASGWGQVLVEPGLASSAENGACPETFRCFSLFCDPIDFWAFEIEELV